MTAEVAISGAALFVTVFGGLAVWLGADSRSKGRSDVLRAVADDRARHAEAVEARVRSLENAEASSMARHEGLAGDVGRIDREKASRDAVDGVRSEVANLRVHMDGRFGGVDTRLGSIEGLLREALSERGSRE